MYIRLLSEILSHDGQTLQRQVMIDDVCHERQHQYSVYGEGEELGEMVVCLKSSNPLGKAHSSIATR